MLYLQIQCMNMHKNILIFRARNGGNVIKICYKVGKIGVGYSLHTSGHQKDYRFSAWKER